MSYDPFVAGKNSRDGKHRWLLSTTALSLAMTGTALFGLVAIATSDGAFAADFDLNGADRNIATTPAPGSFGGLGYLNGADNLSNSGGAATLTEGGGAGVTYSGIISGNTAINHLSGAVLFTGANTHTGGTTISGGVLAIRDGSALGSGGVFVTGGAALDILDGGATEVFNALTLNGTGVSEGGAVRNIAGGHVLRGAITLGSAARINSDDGQLDVNGGITGLNQNLTLGGSNSGVIIVNTAIATGSGSLTVDGDVTVVLSGANTYTGATTVKQGYVQISGGAAIADTSAVTLETSGLLHVFDSETIGSLAGAGYIRLENPGGATLTTGGNNASTTYSGVIDDAGGAASLVKTGTGTFRVTGDLVYRGMTTVSAGTLRLDGWIENDVTVQSGATLSGVGQVNGAATIQSGGTLSAGPNPGMRFGSLTLNAGSTSVFALGAPNDAGSTANDRIDVTGNLALGGTLSVNAPSAGYYRLFTYGTLTPSNFSAVTGSTQGTPTVLTNVANQVNLLIAGAGQQVQFWDGADMSGNGIVGGGPGVWNATNTNWTGAPGSAAQFNDQWRGSVGVFDSATAGSVSLVGTQAFDTLQFSTTGYTLQAGAGGQLQLAGLSGAGTFNIDSSVTTTVNAPIVDGTSMAMSKVGNGTLILGGANSYTGTTTISAGALQVGNGAAVGTLGTGDVLDNALLAFNRSNAMGVANAISGTGGVSQSGAGTATLTGANSYSGTTTISAGTLQVGNGGTVGTLGTGNVINNAALAFNRSDAITIDNAISGSGGVSQMGAGITTLTAANSYTGATTVSGGNLRVNGSLAGSVAVQNGGTLSGTGSIGGAVTVQSGGTLSAGQSPGTITLASLNLTAGSTSVFELGAANVVGGVSNDLVTVTGNLTLGGTLSVNAPSAGYYRLFNYGTLTPSSFAAVTGSTQGTATVLTNVASQVNLSVIAAGQQLQFWDGAQISGDGTVSGGAGVWNAVNTNWTGAPGAAAQFNDQWRGSVGIFSGAAGTVSVVGAQAIDTLQFSTTGYGLEAGAGGRLQLAGSANTGTFNTDNGITATINAPIVDGTSTALAKVGAGTLILGGTNSYSGGTTISGGTLQIGNGGSSGSIAGDVANSGILVFNRSDDTTFGGTISGTGVVLKNGGNALSFTGSNSYSGVTSVAAGTLTGSAFALSPNSMHLILAGATLDLAGQSQAIGGLTGSGTVTNSGGSAARLNLGTVTTSVFSGTIRDGASALALGSAGETVLTGTNTYSGGTTIASGRLYVGNGGTTGSVVGDVVNNGVLNFRRSNSLAFGGRISGGGQVVQDGLGNTTLSGISSYTGATTVNGGTLSVDGAIAASSLTTVNAGGTLGGTGTVGNVTIDGGRLAPGNSIGTLNVAGNLVLTAASNYMVEVSALAADRVDVTGTATLGNATVNASFAAGSYVTKQYTIVNAAGGVTGTFGAQVNTNLPANFTSSLAYDASNAYLKLALNFVPPTPPAPPTPPTPPPAPPTPVPGYNAFSANQQAVANTLVNYFNRTGGIPLAFGALDAAGLTRVSGETATGAQQATLDAMNQFMGLLTDPFSAGRNEAGQGATPFADETMSYAAKRRPGDALAAIYRKAPPMLASFEPRWNVWAAGFGGQRTTDGNTATGSSTATGRLAGTAVGADYFLSPQTVAGFALAGGGTSFSVANAGSGRSDLFQAGVFLRHTQGAAYITAAAAYGWQDITTDRALGTDRLQGRYNANAYSGRIEGGYRFVAPWLGGVGVTPYAAAQLTAFELPAYAESVQSGASTFALNYNGKTVTATRSELGLRSDKSFALHGALLTLRGRAAWAHDTNADRSASATFQTLPGASFVVNGAALARDAALTTASAEIGFRNGISLAATFEGEFSQLTRSYAGKGVVRYAW